MANLMLLQANNVKSELESVMLVADGNGDWISLYEVGTWGNEGA